MSECKCGDVDDEVCDGCWKTNWKLQIDYLTAEVERLRAAITRFVDQYPWQQGPEIQELKALKEGDR